jgi:5-methylcytosine-specific restriction endonuclease McrA
MGGIRFHGDAKMSSARKLQWQRDKRRRFVEEHGFSKAANYADGGNRLKILERDGYKCVRCAMTDAQHKQRWGRPITVDHKNKDRSNNTPDNLQTLCLSCHTRKDNTNVERQVVPAFKDRILKERSEGRTYQDIADDLGFSIAAIWKWIKRWEKEANADTNE